MLAGACARGPHSVSSITSKQTAPPARREAAQVHVGVERVARRRPGRDGAGSCARDGRSASPSSVFAAAFAQRFGTQAMCVRTLVRRLGAWPASDSSSRRRASVRSMSRIVVFSSVRLRHQWRLQERPSRWSSSSEAAGPQVPGRVVGEVRPVARPGGHDRVDDRPLLLHLVGAHEERRVAEQAVEDQPLVRLGQADAERAAVEEVHVHRADREPLAGHLRADRERDALVGLDVQEQHVRAQPVLGAGLERRLRRALELDRDRRLALRQPLARCGSRTACRPSASCPRRASRRRRSRWWTRGRRPPPPGSPAPRSPR